MLGISVLVLAWIYIASSLLDGNWRWLPDYWINAEDQQDRIIFVCALLALIAVAGILSVPVYWNAVKWMLPWLLRSLLCFLGAIPIVNFFVSQAFKSGWLDEIYSVSMEASTADSYFDYWDADGNYNGPLPLIISIPLGIIIALVKGVVRSVFSLVVAIGIPLSAPIFYILALVGIDQLTKISNILALGVCSGAVCLTALLLIVHPILAIRYDP